MTYNTVWNIAYGSSDHFTFFISKIFYTHFMHLICLLSFATPGLPTLTHSVEKRLGLVTQLTLFSRDNALTDKTEQVTFDLKLSAFKICMFYYEIQTINTVLALLIWRDNSSQFKWSGNAYELISSTLHYKTNMNEHQNIERTSTTYWNVSCLM